MLRVAFARIKPEKEQKLRAWLAQLMTRKDEVRETFLQEGMHQEKAYILPTADGPVLVYVMDAEDFNRVNTAYESSTLSIDAEHRAMLAECLGDPIRLAPLYDCSVA